MIKFDFNTYVDVNEEEKEKYKERVSKIKETMYKKEALLDWLDTETCVSQEELKKLKKVASEVRKDADVLVVIGIGGSYLGAKAIYDMFNGYFKNTTKPEIVFAGFAMKLFAGKYKRSTATRAFVAVDCVHKFSSFRQV